MNQIISFIVYLFIRKLMDIEVILQKIRETRKAKGLNQSDMALKLGVTQTMYSNYENGKSEMTLTKFLNVVEILGLDILKFQENISDEDLKMLKTAIDNIQKKI